MNRIAEKIQFTEPKLGRSILHLTEEQKTQFEVDRLKKKKIKQERRHKEFETKSKIEQKHLNRTLAKLEKLKPRNDEKEKLDVGIEMRKTVENPKKKRSIVLLLLF